MGRFDGHLKGEIARVNDSLLNYYNYYFFFFFLSCGIRTT